MQPEEIAEMLKSLTVKDGLVVKKDLLLSFVQKELEHWLSLYILFSQSDPEIAYSYVQTKIKECMELEHGERVLDNQKAILFQHIQYEVNFGVKEMFYAKQRMKDW